MNHISIGQRIKKKREEQHLSLQFVADKLDVNRSSVMRWENGETCRIKLPMLERLAQILKTTPEYLMGYENENPYPVSQQIPPEGACLLPVFKNLPKGRPSKNADMIAGYELAPGECSQNCFFMTICEDSMAPQLEEEDKILVRQQNYLQNGELGVFLLDGQKVLIRLFFQDDFLELHACNPYFPTLRFKDEDKNRLQIIGRVLESRTLW